MPELTVGAGVVWTVRDLSERARLERARSEYVATAWHELRSPLTSIKGFVELLSRQPDGMSERQREFVEIILRSTDRLVDLVEDQPADQRTPLHARRRADSDWRRGRPCVGTDRGRRLGSA